MAEAVFRHKVHAAGLDSAIEIDSAGTGSWHLGSPPHPQTRAVLESNGISHAGMQARQIIAGDLDAYDYILTMDDSNLTGVRALGNARAVVRPLLEYAPHLGVTEVPDPYYVGGYEGVYALVDAACDGLLAAIRRDHHW